MSNKMNMECADNFLKQLRGSGLPDFGNLGQRHGETQCGLQSEGSRSAHREVGLEKNKTDFPLN